MMSLFSSFDLFFFFKNWIIFFFLLTTLFFFFFPVSFLSCFLDLTSLNLSNFFYSLKSKAFNKLSVLVFLSFIFLLVFFNFFSVFSYIFPFTSQVSLVLLYAFGTWLSFVLFSLFKSPKGFFMHFIPEGTPMPLTFLLFLIELVSNLIRPITLTVRLVANILAGHLLMILLSSLVFSFNLAFPLYMILNLVEIFVSLVQAYIFTTMLVLYYSEV